MRMNEETKKKLKCAVEYLEYKEAPFKYALSEFNFLVCEIAEALELDRKSLATFVQNQLFIKLGLEFANKQKELFKEAGLTYCFNQQKIKKEKAKNKAPKRDRVEPYSRFGKDFKQRFGFGSKGNMQLYQASYSYYRQTGKYLWNADNWDVIKSKYGVE